MASGAKKTRIGEEQAEQHEDHISSLPDAVLGEIVSLLRTKEGGRTQVLASRWRHIWSSAPLNIDLHDRHPLNIDLHDRPPFERSIPLARISGILSSHPGPGRRFAIPRDYFEKDAHPAATLDAWLRYPSLDGLQELEFHYGSPWSCRRQARLPPPLPESARRLSSTLHVASFGGCAFPDDSSLQLPLLKQLSLMSVKISEASLYALLAGCPLLQSLMLAQSIGCSRIRIVSPTLRSIGLRWSYRIILDHLTIEDAPFLERLLFFGRELHEEMVVSVISAPKLKILGQLPVLGIILKLGTSIFKRSCVVNSTMVLPCVKVLALTHLNLSLDEVIAFMKCFPCLENLYIKISKGYDQVTGYDQLRKTRVTNAWRQKYRNLTSTLDIRLKKIVLLTYLGNKAHVNFAQFFVLNARVLESMVLEVDVSKYHDKFWIESQQTLLQIEERASRGARFDFVFSFSRPKFHDHYWYEHDLTTADPFVGFDFWASG